MLNSRTLECPLRTGKKRKPVSRFDLHNNHRLSDSSSYTLLNKFCETVDGKWCVSENISVSLEISAFKQGLKSGSRLILSSVNFEWTSGVLRPRLEVRNFNNLNFGKNCTLYQAFYLAEVSSTSKKKKLPSFCRKQR